jgi:hypothetical protein
VNAQSDEMPTWFTENPAFRLGVTGSRDWASRASVWVPLDRMLAHRRYLIVRNGKAKRGVDRFVSEWADRFEDHIVFEDPHPANWNAHGNQAGFLRNQEMVDAGLDALMAWALPCRRRRPWCPPGEHPTHGTFDCVEKARAAKVPIHFSPEGMSW